MPYYKFNKNDVYSNTLKTHPSVKFLVYSGSAFYNNTPNLSGAFADPIRLTDAGFVSLYELNVDRVSSSTGRLIGPSSPDPAQETPDSGLIYSFVVKTGSRIGYRTQAAASFNTSNYGDVMISSYPYTSSIAKEYYSATTTRTSSAYVSHLYALKNTINHYRYLNPNVVFSASSGPVTRDLGSVPVGLINIPGIFYGSEIKKGTIDLKYYITGTLVGQATDKNRDGALYSTYGVGSGSVIGFALYNEGFIVLTASDALSTTVTDAYTSSVDTPAGDNPAWVFFGQSISGSVIAPSSSFIMEFSGTTYTQTLTMFATCPKGQINQSNNPTFVTYSAGNSIASGSRAYIENDEIAIKNIVSSAYGDPTASFDKTTYISKVGIYDSKKNLIGIAKMATPVRKTANRDFTFKIKLDI
tara:strand:- start:1432 stop:2670 length:1239 start_codon:yes stop_codon:yes gene_type:complete